MTPEQLRDVRRLLEACRPILNVANMQWADDKSQRFVEVAKSDCTRLLRAVNAMEKKMPK